MMEEQFNKKLYFKPTTLQKSLLCYTWKLIPDEKKTRDGDKEVLELSIGVSDSVGLHKSDVESILEEIKPHDTILRPLLERKYQETWGDG